jgi:transposase
MRRRWSVEEKLALVAETKSAPVSRVARQHGIASGLLFRWRRQFAAKAPSGSVAPAFVPIALPAPVKEGAAASSSNGAGNGGIIEIELLGGRRLRVDASVDVKALRRLIEALEQR